MATKTPADEVNILPERVQGGGFRDVHLNGHEVVASYNWGVDNDRIFAPGHPPIFLPERVSDRFTLGQEDSSVDLDKYKGKRDYALKTRSLSTGQALMEAVKSCSPTFDVRSVDIVTDRFALAQLLRFCGSPGNSQQTAAKMGVESHYKVLVYDMNPPASGDYDDNSSPTIVFTQFGSDADHEARRKKQTKFCRSMGAKYRARVTETGASLPADATRGYLIVKKVDLDGVMILLRFPADGVERSSGITSPSGSQTVTSKPSAPHQEGDNTINDMSSQEAAMSSMKISACKHGKTTISGSALSSDDKVLEISTKNSRYFRELCWRSFYWHISFGGIDKAVIGLHDCGAFNGSWKNRAVQMSRAEVKKRAAQRTNPQTLSLVYLANTLREITKAAKTILPAAPLTELDGALRKVAIIEILPSTGERFGEVTPLHIHTYVKGEC